MTSETLSALLEVEVASLSPEADGVLAVGLEAPDGGRLPTWVPGSHVDVHLPNGLVRQYSLSSDPSQVRRWRIGVLREPASRGGSEWVHTQLALGDRLLVSAPRNHFSLVDASSYLFIAGGIGITPILPMIRDVAARGKDWRLLYGGRNGSSMAFVTELAEHADRATLWPEDERGLLDLAAHLETPSPGRAVYCCGPEPLLAAVEKWCLPWPPDALHVERFRAAPGGLEPRATDTAFDVVLAHSGKTVRVAIDRTIVEALDDADIFVQTSCREGTCGTCETVVLEGQPDHRDAFLTPSERESGETMMICCSRTLGPRLVLDL